MNYLAHFALSEREPLLLLGAMMGDFRKYLRDTRLPEPVQRGIDHHLRVDRFTDSYLHVRNARSCFSRERRRFAPVIIDVVFDHFLTLHWHRFHPEECADFIDWSYRCLESGRAYMPEYMRVVTKRMIADDWLGAYATLDGIDRALNRMAGRIRFPNRFHNAIEEVVENLDCLEHAFLHVYPGLIDHLGGVAGTDGDPGETGRVLSHP